MRPMKTCINLVSCIVISLIVMLPGRIAHSQPATPTTQVHLKLDTLRVLRAFPRFAEMARDRVTKLLLASQNTRLAEAQRKLELLKEIERSKKQIDLAQKQLRENTGARFTYQMLTGQEDVLGHALLDLKDSEKFTKQNQFSKAAAIFSTYHQFIQKELLTPEPSDSPNPNAP